MQKPDYQHQIDLSLQALRTARDEVRVQAHLLGMNLKQKWQQLEPQLVHAESAAAQATAASAEALGAAVQALIEFRKIMDDERSQRETNDRSGVR